MELGRHYDRHVIYIRIGTVPFAKICTCCKDATPGKQNTIIFQYFEIQFKFERFHYVINLIMIYILDKRNKGKCVCWHG